MASLSTRRLPTYPKSLFPLPSALRDSNLEPSVPGGITR